MSTYHGPAPFAKAISEMNDQLMAFDWSRSSIGAMSTWSPHFASAVRVCMHTGFASMVLAGPEFLAIYNSGYGKILEGRHPDAFGQPVENMWPELWEEISPMLRSVLQKGESFLYENRPFTLLRHGCQQVCYFTFSYSPVFNEVNQVEGVYVCVTDTTASMQNEALLRNLRDRQLKTLFLQAPIAMCILRGPQLVVEVANERMLEIWGKSEEQMMHRPLFEGLSDARDQGFEELLNNVYRTGKRVVADEIPVNLIRNGKHESVYVKLVYEALMEADGSVSAIMAVADEITAQVASRKRIEHSEARLRLAIETTKLGTWDYNLVTGELDWSDECRKIYDFPPDAKVDFALFSELIFPADKSFVGAAIKRAVNPNGLGTYDATYRILRFSDHAVRWINATGKIFFNERQEPERFIGTVIDITDKKELEDKLLESESRTRLAIEASRMGTFEWNLQQESFHYSNSLAQMFGYPKAIGLNRASFTCRIHPEEQVTWAAAHQSALKTGTLLYEARILLPDDSTRWIRLNGKVVYDDDGLPLRMYGTALDITDQKNYAKKLEWDVAERTAQLASQNRELEQFAYVASHDLQEPLRKIQTFSDIIQKNIQDESLVKRYLDKLSNSAHRMTQLIKSVLNYSQLSNGEIETTPTDLNVIVSDILGDFELLMEERGAHVKVDALPTVPGNPLQLAQLFTNLVGNALKFTNVNPIITVASAIVEKSQVLHPPDFIQDTLYAEVSITDNGIGFDQQYEKLIFDMFQRLHGNEGHAGTGIGLALCKKIVENHKGHITARSEPGKGATFYVYLPTGSIRS
jgi:PAS domain S-box-containing protein